ncbi:MAG: DoxX family protein [Gammaproteobacteria bacterium]|jgi:putative oxidoreductase
MNTYSIANSHNESNVVSGHTLINAADLAGRLLLAIIFLIAGVGKITAYAGTAAYMASMGVPGALLPLVIVTELVGGIAIVLGYHTRVVAFLLAGFTLLAGAIFHHDFANQIQMLMFLKDLAIAGGFLLLVVNGAGAWSLDQRKRQKS